MASLAPNRLPPAGLSNRPHPSLQLNGKSNNPGSNIHRHQHSLSTSTPANQHFGSAFSHYGGPRSAGGPRQSLDVSKSLAVNGPLSPHPAPLSALRPNSEILSASHVGGRTGSSSAHLNPADQSTEAEAIDKWFEDLQSYEATLEEMAAASLDVNFKEELSAIEHWFRVLSEAERTAALYSLMQSSTQVQIRFFITVLQQMARSDPMIALLSPAMNPGTPSMEQQMEAKLSQLSMKSPASPAVRQFAHQSLGPSVNVTSNDNFLSPHSALCSESSNTNDVVSLLSSQRAQLGVKSANRLSAPGQLLGTNNSLKSPKWGSIAGPVEEESQSCINSPRLYNTSTDVHVSQTPLRPTFTCTVHPSESGIESQLSPIMGGSWASQVNTPLVPMFANKDSNANQTADGAAASLGDANNRLAQWGAAHQTGSHLTSLSAQTSSRSPANGFPLDDARKFRRQSKVAANSGSHGFPGDFSRVNAHARNTSSPPASNAVINNIPPGLHNRHTNPTNTSRSTMSNGAPLLSPMNTPSMGAQQAAEAAQQNWRNGLNNASLPQINNADPNILNNIGLMNTLAAGLSSGMNLNGMANLAAMANITDPAALQNMANFLNMRQQVQQVQNLQSLQQQLQSGVLGGGVLSPHSGRLGMNFAFPKMSGSPNGMVSKRSPGGRGSGKPTHAPGSGSNPDEELDMKLLNDIPAWLRGLRLHKYTPNFAGCTWQEMVLMSDATLEARGVAAVGARRKMLRTFETVRIIKGMALPGDGANKNSAPTSNSEKTSANQTSTPTNCAPTESDRDGLKNDSSP